MKQQNESYLSVNPVMNLQGCPQGKGSVADIAKMRFYFCMDQVMVPEPFDRLEGSTTH